MGPVKAFASITAATITTVAAAERPSGGPGTVWTLRGRMQQAGVRWLPKLQHVQKLRGSVWQKQQPQRKLQQQLRGLLRPGPVRHIGLGN
jgi:hypothetical protein